MRCTALLVSMMLATSCAPRGTSLPPAFWNELQSLCGRAFEGRVLEAPAGETTFTGRNGQEAESFVVRSASR
jgi:hypothetical protein